MSICSFDLFVFVNAETPFDLINLSASSASLVKSCLFLTSTSCALLPDPTVTSIGSISDVDFFPPNC